MEDRQLFKTMTLPTNIESYKNVLLTTHQFHFLCLQNTPPSYLRAFSHVVSSQELYSLISLNGQFLLIIQACKSLMLLIQNHFSSLFRYTKNCTCPPSLKLDVDMTYNFFCGRSYKNRCHCWAKASVQGTIFSFFASVTTEACVEIVHFTLHTWESLMNKAPQTTHMGIWLCKVNRN